MTNGRSGFGFFFFFFFVSAIFLCADDLENQDALFSRIALRSSWNGDFQRGPLEEALKQLRVPHRYQVSD